LPFHRSSRIFTVSELARFLPGGIVHFAARYRASAREGISGQTIIVTTLLDLAVRIVTGIIVFVITLPWWPILPRGVPLLPVAIVLPLLAVALHPRVLALGIDLGRRLLRRPAREPLVLPYSAVLTAAAWSLLGWMARGFGFYLMASGITEVPSSLAVPAAGIFALAWVVGVLIPIAPGGLGVREAAGTSLLGQLIAVPSAAAIMLASRIQMTLVELAAAGGAVAWDVAASRRKRGRGAA
jgi:uncharacterized membrane protein YbhN (UPF0104 family)